MPIETDFLVLGSGIAGLSYALKAARAGQVLVVTKRTKDESATKYAQGGIASVLGEDDSFEAHTKDTLETGRGLCHREIVELCVADGPARIRELQERGVIFTAGAGGGGGGDNLDLGREGGHSARRIVHAGDITGREVERALLAAAEADRRITFREHQMGIDLIVGAAADGTPCCRGTYVLDKQSGKVDTILARATVLATGGAGKVYLYTSNPDVATGDGVAMAYRAGADVANMEFFQFHPTCLYHPKAKSFLISEALRGEGGVLCSLDGTAFMARYHAMKDLAPRDVVAQAIDAELKMSGQDYVLLDMSARDGAFLRERFPNIYSECLRFGIDMTQEPIPVVPAAHYMCGGVVTDAGGRTTLPGLYAIGETAHTGLHGANRLASNSLLEGLVFGHRAAEATARIEASGAAEGAVPDWDVGSAAPPHEAVIVTQNWDEVRRFMWNYVGIVRSTRRLERARHRIKLLQEEIREYYWDFLVTADLLELRNIALVAELIITSASERRESRGLHYNIDFPRVDDAHFLRDTVLRRPRRRW